MSSQSRKVCKIASLSKIRWEFLEIFSSTLWPLSAISLFLFYINVFNLILVFISIYWSIILLFEFLWAFVKKSVVTFSEYGLGGREQCHKKVYKKENLQQSPFENNSQTLVVCSIRLLFSFFRACSLELKLYSGSQLSNRYCSYLALNCLDITSFILIFLPISPWCKCIFQHDSIKCYEYSIIFKFWKV